MKYSDQDIKTAYDIIESSKGNGADMQKKVPDFAQAFINQLQECNPFEHMEVFHIVKNFTRDRLITDMKNFEEEYNKLRNRVSEIEEFVKTKMQ